MKTNETSLRDAQAEPSDHWHLDEGNRYDAATHWQSLPAAPSSTTPSEPLPIDLARELREALGMFAGAMPCSPKQAWDEAIVEVRRLASAPAQAQLDL